MRLQIRHVLVLLALFALTTGTQPAWGQQIDKEALVRQQQNRLRTSMEATHPEDQILDVNNFTTWISNDGFFDWIDPYSAANGSFPKGQPAGAIFAQGLVWGGQVNDGTEPALRVNGNTYSSGLAPGRVIWNGPGDVTGPDPNGGDAETYHAWRVYQNMAQLDTAAAAASYFGVSTGEITADQIAFVIDQYDYDWENWPAHMGAPYEDVDGDGTYDPDVDVPGYPGASQTIWLVANDLGDYDPNEEMNPSETFAGSPAIGIEYQLTMWGYDYPSSSPLGNMSFSRHRLVYTGTPDTPDDATIDSMFTVMWADPDVGDAGDDYAGVDTSLSLGYAYNGNTTDAVYSSIGEAPPAVGWDFLQGPVNAEGDTLGMTSFVYFAAGSDISDPDLGTYSGTQQWFNLMRGMQPRPAYPAGVPFVNPLTGEPSDYTLTGDPVTGNGWIDGIQLPPSDRRVVNTSGPFSVELGDTVDVVVGHMAALGSGNLSSVTVLKYYDQYAQYAYDNDFVLPSPAPVPPVQARGYDEEVVINWSTQPDAVAETENWNDNGFQFEGYNVYQLPSANASLENGTRIATYDKQNLVSVIRDQVVDEETGFVIERPVQTSPNEGLQGYARFTRDQIRSRPLANGVPYHYAVTTYSYLPTDDPDVPFRYLESSPTVVTVTPQEELPGDEPFIEPTTGLEVAQMAGGSNTTVDVEVVDPALAQGGEYEVRFRYYNPFTGDLQDELAPGDTLTEEALDGLYEYEEYSDANPDARLQVGDPFPVRWALYRDGTRISQFRPQLDPALATANEAPVIEGVRVFVPFVDWRRPAVIFPEGEPWLAGVNAGGPFFGGGVFYGAQFFGSSIPPEDVETVQLVFSDDPDDPWLSEGATYLFGEDYAYNGTGQLPFEAYEVSADGSRRQVNVSFLELNSNCANGLWDLGSLAEGGEEDCTADGLGGREYIFIHASDYDGGDTYDADNPAHEATADVQWAGWLHLAGEFMQNPLTMQIGNPITAGSSDVFSFEVEGRAVDQDSLYEARIERINVFPNPYMGFNQLETNRFDKFVTFSHLPEQATIRIFTLAGTMVRRLEHDDPDTQFIRWDLTNQDELPVSSGIYIVHVETPHGEKVLKLALVQEEQVLERY